MRRIEIKKLLNNSVQKTNIPIIAQTSSVNLVSVHVDNLNNPMVDANFELRNNVQETNCQSSIITNKPTHSQPSTYSNSNYFHGENLNDLAINQNSKTKNVFQREKSTVRSSEYRQSVSNINNNCNNDCVNSNYINANDRLSYHSNYNVCSIKNNSQVNINNQLKSDLTKCFIENNINSVQGDSILKILNRHHCFQNLLPKTTCTLLATPKEKVTVFQMEPGECTHWN